MSRFFIERPIFAWVIAIMMMLAGLLALKNISVEQYPNIAPPSVSISAFMPGASAKTLENSVTQVLEQSLTGIDNLRYFNSSTDANGNARVTLTFEPGTDPDVAQIQVQNKIQTAIPLLPTEVQQQGLVVSKANSNFLLVVGIYSEDGKFSEYDIGDLMNSKLKERVARINGVGEVSVFGEQKSMRIWLNPNKLYSFNLSISDVISLIRSQNIDVSSGQLGGSPAMKGQEINATITSQSRLQTPEQFRRIVLKVNGNGSRVLLKDVAKVALGSENYNVKVRYKGMEASGMIVILASGANAMKTADAVKAKVAEFEKTLPSGLKVIYPYDSTKFIKISIESVVHTLIEAIFLVFLVILLFLQNFRATLIPTIAVPVVLLGTVAVLYSLGFTINTLTMFAMVLAIGLLVDDAIVVVENVERIMHEEGLSPKEATKKSADQITGALVGIATVLSAVFVPMAFFPGSAGAIYRQFSITVVTSMVLSVVVALILSPSLCATILKPSHGKPNRFAQAFNGMLNKTMNGYFKSSSYMVRRSVRFILIYLLLTGGMVFMFGKLPTSFLPTEDQGMMYMMMMKPDNTSLERTRKDVEKIEEYLLNDEKDNIEHVFTVTGYSSAGRAQNVAFGFLGLKDWSQRKRPDQSVFAISGRTMGALNQRLNDAMVFTFYPPPIRELGNASGFDLQLLDVGGIGHDALMGARNQLLGMASQSKLLVGTRPNGLNDVPQLKIDLDYAKAMGYGVTPAEVNQTISTALGASFVNNFLDSGRVKRVYIQGDAPYRMGQNDIKKWYAKNANGQMVSFASFAKTRWIYGSPKLERFNGASSINIQGAAAPGVSSGQAMLEIENMISNLPEGIGYAWSGLSYEEKSSQSQTLVLYAISILVVFLSLAALYESWSIPFAVILIVPFGILGTIVASIVFKMSNDVYFQVGLLTTIGLSAKNAILIIEFARTLMKSGKTAAAASLEALKLRFRPIIMTSMAFLLGILPLALATGAGSMSQKAIGIGVIGGMLMSTTIAVVFVPLFYILISNFFSKAK